MRPRLLGLILAVAVAPAPAAAQAPGLPVMSGGLPRGVTLATMVGFGNAAAGSGTALGLSGAISFRRVAVGGFVSTLGGSTLSENAFRSAGATLSAKILGGPLVPLSVILQAGAGYSKPSFGPPSTAKAYETWRVPVGLGISLTIPQPVVAVKPWIAPRLDHSRVTGPPGIPVYGSNVQPIPNVTTTSTDFGLSGGITFGFLNGLSIELAADRVFAGGSIGKPTTVGIGVSFNVK